MENWQELIDYVYGEIDGTVYFKKHNRPNMNNILALANESLLGLTVDYISFYNDSAVNDVAIIDMPNALAEVFRVNVNGEEVKRCNKYAFRNEKGFACLTGEFKIKFNKKFSADVGGVEIIGKGKFDLFTKDPNDTRFFELMPLEFHYLPAYFILQRLFIRAGDREQAKYYADMYNQLYRKYDWSLVEHRTEEAKWQVKWTKEDYQEEFWQIFYKIPIKNTPSPTITPQQVDDKIEIAVNSLKDWTYDKDSIDSKDSGVLSSAKGYTYSKNAIDNKDTTTKNNAIAYTDEKLGDIENVLDKMLEE